MQNPDLTAGALNIPSAGSVSHSRKISFQKGKGGRKANYTLEDCRLMVGTVLIGYCDYLRTRPKNSHWPIIVTGQ